MQNSTNWLRHWQALRTLPSPRYLLMTALPPVANMVPMAIAILIAGYTMLSEDSALLPTKRETKIPSTIVYSDIKIIMMIDGAANFNNDNVVKCWLMELFIFSAALFLFLSMKLTLLTKYSVYYSVTL